MATSSRAQEKLETDLLNFALKPLALLLNPSLAIILFALALHFSWKHNKAHLRKTELVKPDETEADRLHRERKRRIIKLRMRFDALGLVVSIVVLALQLIFAATQLQSFFHGLLMMAAISMVVSSGMSTVHKAYRLRKVAYEWSRADIFRVFFGVAGTVILAGVLFHFIPRELMMNPVVITGTVLVMLGLAVHKTYRVYQEQQAHAKRLHAIDNVGDTLDALVSSEQLKLLLILRKDGYYEFDTLLEERVKHITQKIETKQISKDTAILVKHFFEQLGLELPCLIKLDTPRKSNLAQPTSSLAVKKRVTWSPEPPTVIILPPTQMFAPHL